MHSAFQADHLTGSLAALGASPDEIDELLRYNENVFNLATLGPGTRFPLPDEPFVAFWESIAAESRERGAVAVLTEHLPQLHFPVLPGMSGTVAYQAATRRGVPVAAIPEAIGLEVEHPELVEIALYQSPAGRIPLLVARGRQEFVTLVQALGWKNEPRPVPDSQGALMVSGFNNWSRIRELKRRWESHPTAMRDADTWDEEFARLKHRRELYQDRFILLSNGPYSGVPAAALGLPEAVWQDLSLAIRRDHECAHYLTRRLFGSMRNNLLDELIADYAGLVAATGRFRADWFLRFMGLESFPCYRPGGRLEIYRGDPPLSDGAFRVVQALLKAAAENLEAFDAPLAGPERGLEERAVLIATLASLRLEEIAAPGAEQRLTQAVTEVGGRLAGRAG